MFFAPFDVVFSPFDVAEPHVLDMSHQRAKEILTSEHVEGVPELVIEIASKRTRKRDETIKRHLYERSRRREDLPPRGCGVRARDRAVARRGRHADHFPDARAIAHAMPAPVGISTRKERSHAPARMGIDVVM